jgi:hypothetical protein
MVVAVLHNAVKHLTDRRGYLCAPMVAITIGKVYVSFLIVVFEDFD